jgi:photosystem II stability/assembly factor-like uncharacterized protein
MKTMTIAIMRSAANTFAQQGWYWQNPLPQGNRLRSVIFTNAKTGTAVGARGTILRTTDGSVTWMEQSMAATLMVVSFAKVNEGIVVGDGGTILHTSDAGVTWKAQTSGTKALLCGVSSYSPHIATIVGEGDIILRTTSS